MDIGSKATSAGCKKVSPIALPVLKLAAEPAWLCATLFSPAQLMSALESLKCDPSSGGFSPMAKDHSSEPSALQEYAVRVRARLGGSRGESFGPAWTSPSGTSYQEMTSRSYQRAA